MAHLLFIHIGGKRNPFQTANSLIYCYGLEEKETNFYGNTKQIESLFLRSPFGVLGEGNYLLHWMDITIKETFLLFKQLENYKALITLYRPDSQSLPSSFEPSYFLFHH